MDKTITTALLIVISMVTAVALFNAAYPAVIKGGDAITSMANRADDRMQSQIAIIHMAGEQDSQGQWQTVYIWVKNIGASSITAIERSDVFFGPEGDFVRVPYQAEATTPFPYWTWDLENGTEWLPTGTVKITIHNSVPLAPGRYFAKVIIPTGVSDEQFLGL